MTGRHPTPRGFRFSAVEAAIKAAGRLDLGLIACRVDAAAAGVFTRNRVVAAPVIATRERVPAPAVRGVLVNAGNANACTAEEGLRDARYLGALTAERLAVAPEQVLLCSTGVIGLRLPVDRMAASLPALTDAMTEDCDPFARSILTTDTFPKVAYGTVAIDGRETRILGIAKGAGMIRPDMATMLGFLLTDAAVSSEVLQGLLADAVDRTFNRITVDGDTSTNDTVLALASGLAGHAPLEPGSAEYEAFSGAVEQVCRELARMIVRDGEGATKVVDVRVCGAADRSAAEAVARTIAESPLVKTALHGEDPNWGRIVAAVGRSDGYGGSPVGIEIGGVEVVRDGLGLGRDAEARAHAVMRAETYEIAVTLQEGDGEDCVTTCDLTAEYVRINADYRS